MKERTTYFSKDTLAFRDFLHKLSRNEMIAMVDRIVQGCMVPRHTVWNWSRGLSRIPALHKCKIEEIIGEKIFDTLTICEK